MSRIVFLSFIIFIVGSCASSVNPITGKKPFNMVSNRSLFPSAIQEYQKVLKESKVSTDKVQIARVKRVGTTIQKQVELYLQQKGESAFLEGYAWEYNVLEEDDVNAWCMPGGKVAFFTGILPICNSDDGIAVVMGHEMVHALADHAAQRISQAQAAQIGQVAGMVALGVGGAGSGGINLFNQLYGVGASIGLLSYSRKQESEADLVGLELMARAGYDPREAPRFWLRMEEYAAKKEKAGSNQKPPEFLSTHPSPETRMSALEAKIPQVLPLYYQATGKTK